MVFATVFPVTLIQLAMVATDCMDSEPEVLILATLVVGNATQTPVAAPEIAGNATFSSGNETSGTGNETSTAVNETPKDDCGELDLLREQNGEGPTA